MMTCEEIRTALRDCYREEDKARQDWEEIVKLDLARFGRRRVQLLGELQLAQALEEK